MARTSRTCEKPELPALDCLSRQRHGAGRILIGDRRLQLAKQVFNVPSTVAVVVDPENASLFEMLGVDDVVSLTDLAMTRLAASVPAHPVVRLMPIAGRNREMVAIKIPAGAEVVNRMLSEIVLPYGSSVILVIGPTGQTEEPRLDTVLGAEDEVIVVTPVEGTQTLWETLTEMP